MESSMAHRSESALAVPGRPNSRVREITAGEARDGRPLRSTATGVRLPPRMSFDAWRTLGERLGRYSNGTAWWLGDWLTFGEAKYGRRYKEAIAATGLDYKTLRNYAGVSRRFELSRRRDNLTFHHHAEVCALCDEEQDRWLDLAAAKGWSKNELRRAMREAAVRLPARRTVVAPPGAFAPGQLVRWREAAERRALRLDAWIGQTLDEAAEATLDDE